MNLQIWSVVPFILLLVAIAVLPLLAENWWHWNRNKAFVCFLLAAPTVFYLCHEEFNNNQPSLHALAHELAEYVSFILLLGALYTVVGGIVIFGDLEAKPLTNTLFLATGAAVANLIGTTGASVLLIRPVLRINRDRVNTRHLPVFFIFSVSNLAGLLTPLGDPPLFLGFLKGVPFEWTLGLWPQWLLANGIVLITFFVWDWLAYRKETQQSLKREHKHLRPLHVRGLSRNGWLLGGIVGAVLLQGQLDDPWSKIVSGTIMLFMAILSLALTDLRLRKANDFQWAPIVEVAILFLGIFITMTPALEILTARRDIFRLTEPWQFFWCTGGLSAFLDNAPTYLIFATMAARNQDLSILLTGKPPGLVDGPLVLQAISCGAVFMGAMTYIGNGPNFMVKAIADHAGYKTPSFFGYLGYALVVLIPIFVVVTLVFFVAW